MKVKTLLTTTLCGMVMFSCSTGDEETTRTSTGEPAEVSLIIEGGKAATRADVVGSDEENAISSIEFYVFESTGLPDTKVGGGSGYVTGTAADITKRIIVTSGDDKKFVAVVNSSIGAVTSYAALKAELSKKQFTLNPTNSRDEIAGGFEMTGEAEADVAPASTNTIVRITVERLVSRVNAPYYLKDDGNKTGVILDEDQIADLWGDDSGILPSQISFNPLGYAVINGLDKSHAFVTSRSSSWWNGKTYLNSTFTTPSPGYCTSNYSGQGVGGDWFLNGEKTDNEHRVYLHENNPQEATINGETGWDALTVNAIMLKGELVVAGNPSLTKERYWRVNLTRDDDYHIERNCIYDVYIQNIITIGHETPEEGETEPPIIPPAGESQVEVRISVSNWTFKEYKTEV